MQVNIRFYIAAELLCRRYSLCGVNRSHNALYFYFSVVILTAGRDGATVKKIEYYYKRLLFGMSQKLSGINMPGGARPKGLVPRS